MARLPGNCSAPGSRPVRAAPGAALSTLRFKALRLPAFDAKEAVLLEVAGIVAGPFGIYKDPREPLPGPRLPAVFHLVHVPTGSHLAKLPLRKRCKSLARELATYRVTWDTAVPEEVTGPELWKSQDAIRRAQHIPPTARRSPADRRNGMDSLKVAHFTISATFGGGMTFPPNWHQNHPLTFRVYRVPLVDDLTDDLAFGFYIPR